MVAAQLLLDRERWRRSSYWVGGVVAKGVERRKHHSHLIIIDRDGDRFHTPNQEQASVHVGGRVESRGIILNGSKP